MSKVDINKIDKLAEDYYPYNYEDDKDLTDKKRDAFVEGYYQNQESNAIEFSLEDIKHLEFIYARMIHLHNENENTDYMIKFKSMIQSLTK